MKKLVLITLLSLMSLFGFSQTVTNNFQDGNWLYYYNLCWGIGPNDNYFGTKVIGNGAGWNGTDVMETAQLKGNSSVCRLISPWTHVISGNITFDHKLFDKSSTVVLKVISIKAGTNEENELFVYQYSGENSVSTSFPVTLNGNYKIMWKWEGNTQKSRIQLDNIVIPGTNVSDPSNNCQIYVPPVVPDTTINYYPASDTSTLAFEDLWPNYGDYDMNDLVMGYKFQIISYTQTHYVKDINVTFVVRAQGAGLANGFGFQLPNVNQTSISSVTGVGDQSGYSINTNGTENGNSKATFIIFDDTHKFMTSWNTVKGQIPCPWKTFNIHIKFVASSVTLQQLNIQTWNPFMIKGGVRGQEIHLPDYKPTDLVDISLFGTGNDDTKPGINRYYKSTTNLPWAIDIYGKFYYPTETSDISNAYLHFGNWAESNGQLYQDWWLNTGSGYRNENLIY